MKISSKILWTTIPLLVLAFVAAAGVTFYFSRSAMSSLAEQWLATRSTEAVRVAESQAEFLEAFGLSEISASVAQAQSDAFQLMSEIDIGQSGLILVAGQDGTVLNLPDGGSIADQPGFQAMVPGGTGQVSLELKGAAYQSNYRYFAPWDWYILATAPESVVYGAVNRLGGLVLILGLAGSLVIALAVVVLTRRLTAPLTQLVQGAERVGAGQMDVHIDITSRDEVGILASSFNAMTAELRTLYSRLEERLATVVSKSPIILFAADEEGTITLLEGHGLGALGLAAESHIGLPLDDLFAGADSARGLIARAAAGEEVNETIEVQDQVFDMWCAPMAARNPGAGGVIGVATNVTDQAKAQQELREQAAYLTSLNAQVLEKNQMLESLSTKLSKYLSPQVYSSIFSGSQSVEIAAKRKKLTVFFSDLAGFTETTDKLESEELTALLNQYLTEMSDIALKHGATIDKYVGDAIVIFFGDPETRGVTEDARACVRMAVEMQERMRHLAAEWRSQGIESPLMCRIGINTGYCTVGNFGSKDRMDYTIVGGGVNLAARLESMAVPGEILVSFETYSHVKDVVACEEFGKLDIRGMAYPVTTFQVKAGADASALVAEEKAHFQLKADFGAMPPEEKAEVARILQTALSKVGPADS